MREYTIDYQGLSLGMHYFEFEVNDALFAKYEGSLVSGGKGKVVIEMNRHNAFLELFVTISAQVEVVCDRCLEKFVTETLFQGELVVRISDQQGEYDGDIMWVNPSDPNLDLSQYIYESIVLSLPYQIAHPNLEECNQDMLKRFNIVSDKEFEEIENKASNSPFANLDVLTAKE